MSAPATEIPGSGAVSGQAERGRRLVARHDLAVAGVCYLIAALVVTMWIWRDPASRIVAGNPADPDQSAWWIRYAASEVAHWRIPALITAGLNAPVGVNAMWNVSLLAPGVVLAPVTLLAGPQVTLNVMLTAGFAGSALSLYWVLRRWSCGVLAAGLGGLAYGFSPAITQSAMGHIHLQFAVLPPLIVHALLRLPRDPVRCGAWLGLLAAVQLLTSEEVLFNTGVAVIILLATLAVSRARAPWPAGVAVSVTSGLLVASGVLILIAGYPLWTQFFGPLTEQGSPYIVDFYKNDPLGFVQPSARQIIHSSSSVAFTGRFPPGMAEYLGYIGWPMLVLVVWAAVTLWRVLPIRLLAVTFVVLEVFSLGGMLLTGGHVHGWVKLPWYWLQELPVADSAIVDRFSIIADGCAAALLALALEATWREAQRRTAGRGRRVIGALIIITGLVAVVPMLPSPLPADSLEGVPAGWATALGDLRLPYGASVLALPVPSDTFTAPLRWQADTGLPSGMVGGYFMGPVTAGGRVYVDGPGLSPAAKYLNWLWVESGPGQAAAGGVEVSGKVRPAREVKTWITSSGLSAVVAVTTADSPLAAYLDRMFGQPAAQSGAVVAWRVHPAGA